MEKYIIAREESRSKPLWKRQRFVCYKDGGKVGYILLYVGQKRALGSYIKMRNYKSALVKEVTIKESERRKGLASVILAAIMDYLEQEAKEKEYTYYLKSWIPFTKDAWCWRKRYFPYYKSIIIGSEEQKKIRKSIGRKYQKKHDFVFYIN